MAPNPRVLKAFRAMKAIGINEDKVKPVLKKLLKLYDKNWELIEEENYRVLADAIFDADDSKCENSGEEAEVHDEPSRPLKRLRLRGQEVQASSSVEGGMLLKRPKIEADAVVGTDSYQHSPDMRKLQNGSVSAPNQTRNVGKQPISPIGLRAQGSFSAAAERTSDSQWPLVRRSYKGKEPMLPQGSPKEKRPIMERPSHALRIKDNVVDPGLALMPNQKVADSHALIIPKDEPFTDDLPLYEAPIAVIRPDSLSKEDNSIRRIKVGEPHDQESPASHFGAENHRDNNLPVPSKKVNSKLQAVPEESLANIEIASSSMGEVKITLSCNSMLRRPIIHMPGRDELLKSMQEKCLRSYKIFDPNFSVLQILKDMCECFLELATDSCHESQERLMNGTPTVDVLKKSAVCSALNSGGIEGSNSVPENIPNGSAVHSFTEESELQAPKQVEPLIEDKQPRVNGNVESDTGKKLTNPGSHSLVVVPQHLLTSGELRSLQNFNDLAKGEEVLEISWLNEISNECPPSFNYIPGSLIFQNAHLKFTLSQIKAEDCCSTCIGDCLSSTIACVCASEAGDMFAYTSDGLIREDFLEYCISMTRDPQQQCLSYCKACPLERSKNDGILEPCKGHLKRKYIKECWRKCACHKRCGNRVVQRGIRHQLQVFFTPEGKGWGLRTLEKLPKGTFVCEYVGEILTNKELHERNMERRRVANNKQCTYPVLLDAYWFSKGALKDEEALCLDATFYGNVARFINHRCLDANLIEIPVKMESPDNHYYHLAFFTTREVNALEELTWDYGIDFDDNDQPLEVFRCLCGSKFCRNMKRSSRSKAASR